MAKGDERITRLCCFAKGGEITKSHSHEKHIRHAFDAFCKKVLRNETRDYFDELTHYEAAERYLNAVMNGKTGIPLKAWKAERDKLSGEKKELTQQYYALKDEVKEVEQIRRNVYSILREENGREQPTRKHEHER